MDAIGLIVGAVILAAGAVAMLWLADRSATGKLKPNGYAGVRTTQTLASDDAWYAAQRAAAGSTAIGGWGALASSLIVIVLCILALTGVFDVPAVVAAAVTMGAGIVWLLVFMVRGASLGIRASADVR